VLARRWAADPAAPALAAGEGHRSAGGLDEASAVAAGRLAALGVGPGDRLVWACRPGLAATEVLLGALRLGAVAVPLNPAVPPAEADAVVRQVAPALAVADDPAAVAGLGSTPVRPPSLSGVRPDGSVPLDAAGPGAPALVVFTSGTTGPAKGAVLTQGNLAAGTAALAEAWAWEPADRLLLTLPLTHVHGLVAGLLGSLAAGAGVVLLGRFEAGEVLEAVGRERATLFFGVPTMYHRLAAHPEVARLGRLRLCVSGSAPLAPVLWHRMAEAAGVQILERYGMTETLLTLSNPLSGPRRPGTVGRPLPGVRVRVGDGAEGAGGEGELFVAGPTVFAGYWGRPEATAAVLSDGWFRTGDLVRTEPDGAFVIEGRRDDLIICGGHNVHPTEVEDVLLAHPAVAEAAVAGRPSDEWGQQVEAWVVADGPGLDPAEVVAFCAARLAPYKVPTALHPVAELPRNALGKVQRRALS
jgi:malonyl-CoA/methylmalonyl-CoA synthetase